MTGQPLVSVKTDVNAGECVTKLAQLCSSEADLQTWAVGDMACTVTSIEEKEDKGAEG